VPKEPKKCRNAISAQGNPVLTYTINTTTNVNAAIDEISITGGHALSTGMPIQFSAVADNFALKPNRTYFAIVVTGTRFKVAATFLDSLSSTQIDLVANSIAGSIIITAAPATDTVDDFYSSALSPALWNDEYNCNEKNFEEVSNSASWLIPSSEGTWGAWTNIWHDRLSGLYFTNIQPSTSPFTFNWQTGMSICTNGLNSGDGFGKWRMPTQKELMQLYINGIGNVVNSAGNNLAPWSSTTDTTFVWSSTLNSGAAATVWGINLGNGKVYYLYRTDKTMYLMCVRDAQ
jgi:hypothetical protein